MIYLFLTYLLSPVLRWRAERREKFTTGRLLVIQTAKIGDFVATTPVFRALKTERPHAEIVALLSPVNVALAEGLDSIDRVIALPAHGFKGWVGKRWLLNELSVGYDGVLILSPNLTNLLAPLWAGIPQRVAVLPDRRQGIRGRASAFLTHGEAHIAGRLFRETALRALAGFGLVIDDQMLALPAEVPHCESGEAKRKALLAGANGPFVGLGLGAGNRLKALESSQLLELATGIVERPKVILVLVGTAADQSVAAELLAALPHERVIDTTGRWTLAELPSLLAALNCFVGVDSGATYMADALGVPVVDFMGPADADDQRPTGRQAAVIRSTEPCAPCSHAFDAPYRCRLGTRACIANAPLSEMITQIARLTATIGKKP